MNHRIAIVTGAGKRVGKVIAETLVERGWQVVAHVHDPADAVPDGAIKVAADLTDEASAAAVMAACAGAPSLLVNNAARFAPDTLEAFSEGEFAAHMAVNVAAPVRLTAAFASVARTGASVVNILDAKLAAPNPDFLSYTLSKQALDGFTQLAARALAGKGIRVNAVAPSLMLRSPGQDEANFKAMHALNPLRRGVEPTDVAEAVLYLAEARAMTGQVLTLDGGQHFWTLPRDVQFLTSDPEK